MIAACRTQITALGEKVLAFIGAPDCTTNDTAWFGTFGVELGLLPEAKDDSVRITCAVTFAEADDDLMDAVTTSLHDLGMVKTDEDLAARHLKFEMPTEIWRKYAADCGQIDLTSPATITPIGAPTTSHGLDLALATTA
ncbi:MAG TPA: hypothetical protein VFO38_05780 [Candidatus Saccharimonadales bacterium]|nr:hypothetical protein [Candidatus Saccharimonadales bacterium]